MPTVGNPSKVTWTVAEAKLASGWARVWPAEKARPGVHWASVQVSAEAPVLPEAKVDTAGLYRVRLT